MSKIEAKKKKIRRRKEISNKYAHNRILQPELLHEKFLLLISILPLSRCQNSDENKMCMNSKEMNDLIVMESHCKGCNDKNKKSGISWGNFNSILAFFFRRVSIYSFFYFTIIHRIIVGDHIIRWKNPLFIDKYAFCDTWTAIEFMIFFSVLLFRGHVKLRLSYFIRIGRGLKFQVRFMFLTDCRTIQGCRTKFCPA